MIDKIDTSDTIEGSSEMKFSPKQSTSYDNISREPSKNGIVMIMLFLLFLLLLLLLD
jgi:hypothetical protein